MMAVTFVLTLIPATAAAVYYHVLSALGWWPIPIRHGKPARTRFAVVVPAHDEESVLATTLEAVSESLYPGRLVRTLVVADNCSDGTAAVARRLGTDVLERFDDVARGKGHALAYGLPHALAGGADAVLVLDADCRLDPNALAELDHVLAEGAEVAQAAVTMGDPNAGPAGLVMAVGSEIENAVQAGLSRVGGTVRLRGTGMAFRRDVLERHPWQSFGKAEDAEYSAVLRRAGVRVTFVPTATLRNTPPADTAGLCQQRRRWRDALFTDAAGPIDRFLTSKPLVLAQLGLTTAVAGLFAILRPGPTSDLGLVWVGILIAMTMTVYLRAAVRTGATVGTLLNLWRTPVVVSRLAWVTLGGIVSRGGAWERTPRGTTGTSQRS